MGNIAGKIVLYIFCGLFGLFFLIYGVACIGSGIEGIGDLKIYSGTLKVTAPAKDKTLGLTDMGPVLFREAQMYQWTKEEVEIRKNKTTTSYPYAEPAFKNYHIEPFMAYSSRSEAREHRVSEKQYKNPPFPKDFLNGSKSYNNGKTVICGNVEIADKGIRLDKSLLKLFDGSSYCLDDCRIPADKTPKNAGKKYGLKLVGKGRYATRKGDDHKIGDLDVTYMKVNPKIIGREFTAVGILSEDKVLSMDGERGALYDSIVSADDVNKDYRNDQFKEGIMFILIGVAIIGIGVAVGTIFL